MFFDTFILKFKLVFLTLLLSMFSIPSVVGYSQEDTSLVALGTVNLEKPQTLRETQNYIETLEQEKKNLEFKWETFRIGNGSLSDFMKKDLSQKEKNDLTQLILNYKDTTYSLEKELQNNIEGGEKIDETKKALLMKKQDFYISLLGYISPEKLLQFKDYVTSDLLLYEKSKDVSLEINQKNIEQHTRVSIYEKQAQENGVLIRNQIQEKIRIQLASKLESFTEQEKFKELPNETKVVIFQKISDKLGEKSQSLEQTLNPTQIIVEKLMLYGEVQNVLKEYIQKWK